MNPGRRILLQLAAWSALGAGGVARAAATEARIDDDAVRRGAPLRFPRDHGAHPGHRIEWWYLTGVLRDADAQRVGVQVTFFRSRPGVAESNPSRFAPRQLLFAHAALADPRLGALRHDQRAARAAEPPGIAGNVFARGDTRVAIRDWTLERDAGGRYHAALRARGFSLRLVAEPTQPLLLQGDAGWSQKGPSAGQASFYYSQPHLRVTGEIEADGRRRAVRGEAWLDHEWSSSLLDPRAAGWDWVGLNLSDGSALMAFRIRAREGGAVLWTTALLRERDGRVQAFEDARVSFHPLRHWRSPRTQALYPVAMALQLDGRRLVLEPLMDDQELDARRSVGSVYWEGAVVVRENDAEAGQGYLELTGYAGVLRL